jgi:acyl-CoA thioesterase-1
MRGFKLNPLEVTALLLTIFIAGLVYAYPVREYKRDQIVVAFGDSLTRGYGTPPGKNFVTYLSEYTNIPIINSGKSGDTTSDALVRLKEDVIGKQPDVVLVLLGGNDFFEGNSEEVVRVNLKTIIRDIRASGAKVILIGGSKQILPNYESVFERLALEEKVEGYVPNVLLGVLFRKDLLYDSIHPNERGHEIIAKRILPTLEKVLKEK